MGLATARDRCDNNISTMSMPLSIASLKAEGAPPRYEQIASALCQAIRSGQLRPGDRLPTLRRLASDLEVSLTTVTAAFKSLAEDGWTRGEVGRGTFVAERGAYESAAPSAAAPVITGERRWPRVKSPWRRRALVSLMGRLRSTFPHATNCSFGGPGPALLPLKLIKRHWLSAFDDISNCDLQYNTVDPIERVDRGLAGATGRGWHSSSERRPSRRHVGPTIHGSGDGCRSVAWEARGRP